MPDRRPLPGAQPLTQDEHTEEHADERVDEVAEGGLDRVAAVHGVDVGAPVDRDDRRGDREEREPAWAHVLHPPPVPAGGEDDADDDERPDDAVREDLDRTGRLQQRPVQREQTPQDIGPDSVQDPTPHIRHGRQRTVMSQCHHW
jgi:hypothetical protein